MRHSRTVVALLLTVVQLASHAAAAEVFPGKEWEVATPESQGLSAEGLDKAAKYAQKHAGVSGCIIRHGYLVKEWGSVQALSDIKSCTKGSVGTTMLGLAIDAGLVKIEDLAQAHYPQIGREKPENVETGWLNKITIRHLATMTAGFDDGRPPKLVYEPGTKGIYSNDTSNMLAELLMLKFKEDLSPIFKRQVMDVIGASPKEWTWRENSFRPKTMGDLKTREFASGIRITHRALARIGYLYLHGGEWNGKRVLSKSFVEMATRPTDLPAPFNFYGFYWGTNGRGTYAGMPKDTCWALGLGDSFVVYSPSLDVVAVRLGDGSRKSHLPGGEDWGGRVEGFFKIIVEAIKEKPAGEKAPEKHTAAPCPPSPAIASFDWAPVSTIRRFAIGSDNWPLTWGDDDAMYGAYGDGNGWEPQLKTKLSLGLVKITGGPEDFTAINLRSATGEQVGNGKAGKKASGMLMVKGVLYMWVRNAGNSQLAISADHGRTWEFAKWKFTQSFGCPTFLNFGRDYAGARDGYAYVFSPDTENAYTPADRMVLARAPADRIGEREAYEFFVKMNSRGEPEWSKEIAQRGAVFANPGRCCRSGVTYNAGLNRYFWCQTILGSDHSRLPVGLGIFDAPEPWGPWTTVAYAEKWDTPPGDSASFPSKWMSADGRVMYLVFAGEDSFSMRRVEVKGK